MVTAVVGRERVAAVMVMVARAEATMAVEAPVLLEMVAAEVGLPLAAMVVAALVLPALMRRATLAV